MSPEYVCLSLCLSVCLSVCLCLSVHLTFSAGRAHSLEFWHGGQVEGYLGRVSRSRSWVKGQGHEVKKCSLSIDFWEHCLWVWLRRNSGIHSVSKETHHEIIGFPWNPGSRSGDPGRVVFYHGNLKQVAKNPIQKCQMVLKISWKVQGYVMIWNS